MPLYEVYHTVRLTPQQMESIAEHITVTHSELYRRPRLFVNVIFHHELETTTQCYAGGKLHTSNRVVAHIRTSNRAVTDMDYLARSISDAWTRIVGGGEEHELRGVFIIGTVLSAVEGGLTIPRAGEEDDWLVSYLPLLQKRAADGHMDSIDLLQDIEHRNLLPSRALAGVADVNVELQRSSRPSLQS